MKKTILLVLFVAVIASLFVQTPAYALDTSKVTIEGRHGFTASLKSNSLVFTYKVTDNMEYESAIIKLRSFDTGSEVYSEYYDIRRIDGTTLNLSGYPDGTYRMEFIFFPSGTSEIIEAMLIFSSAESSAILANEELYQLSSYESDDVFGHSMEKLLAWANVIRSDIKIKDYNRDGVPDKYNPYRYSSYEEAYEDAFRSVFNILNSGDSLLKYINPLINIVIENGKAKFSFYDAYIDSVRRLENLRTDEYVLDYYKSKWIFNDPDYADVVKQAQIITDGITDDYEKAKAIQKWVTRNIAYSYDAYFYGGIIIPVSAPSVLKYRTATCEGIANLTAALLQAVGIPAKTVSGSALGFLGWGDHAWTEAFIDNRWVFIDSTYGDRYFDLSPAVYISSHRVSGVDYEIAKDKELWDGTLYFFDVNKGKVVKEVKNFPLNGLVTSTYGFHINDMYLDPACTKPFTLNTFRVDAVNRAIFVNGPKECTVTFYIQLDNEYKSIIPYVIETRGYDLISYVTVPYGSKLTPPKPPVMEGYTFIGWYDSIYPEDAKLWDFEKDVVTEDMFFLSCFVKESASYTVNFNSNGGTAVKSVKAKAGKPLQNRLILQKKDTGS